MGRALVTGGNRGIGEAIAKGLADLGHEVVIGARDLDAGQQVADAIGGEAVSLDLTDLDSIRQAAQAAGPVDMLINNAGVLFQGSMLEDPEGFQTSLDVMLTGPYHLIRLLSPGMATRGYGRIVNVSSGWGAFEEGLEGPNAYGVAKAGLNALSKALVRDLPPNVKVNAMCPGWVRSRMGGPQAFRSVEEGADTALWLATLPDDGPTGGFFKDRKPKPW